jgi:DNA (cytosine-5)-methyltransferase 1
MKRGTRQSPAVATRTEIAAPRKALDLFSGAGGMTLGLKQAGFAVVGAIEIDSLSVETYGANHPEVRVWESDIRKLRATTVMRALCLAPGELDLLAGCPPCQGFSTLTTMNGAYIVEDPRNDLVLAFVRFARALQPKAIMLENVPGLEQDARFRRLCRELEKLDYVINAEVLDAADYAVPQRRKRLIALAAHNEAPPLADPAEELRTVRDAIAKMAAAGASGDTLHDLPEKRSRRIRNLIRDIPADGGSRLDLPRRRQLACHKGFDGFKDIYGRMAWDAPAPTITGGCANPSKGRFLHPVADRNVSLREAALLQSFPPEYEFSLRKGKFKAAELIGNALPPEFVRRHAASVHGFLDSREQ